MKIGTNEEDVDGDYVIKVNAVDAYTGKEVIMEESLTLL